MNHKQIRNAAQAVLQAQLAGIAKARELGQEYFREYPDLMLVNVAREGAHRFTETEHQIGFLQGYSRARMQHDEFLRESER